MRRDGHGGMSAEERARRDRQEGQARRDGYGGTGMKERTFRHIIERVNSISGTKSDYANS